MATKEKKANKYSTIIFLVGLLVFALGIVAYLLNYTVPSPLVPPVTLNGLTLYALFLNWVVIAGIVLMTVGFVAYYLMRKRTD